MLQAGRHATECGPLHISVFVVQLKAKVAGRRFVQEVVSPELTTIVLSPAEHILEMTKSGRRSRSSREPQPVGQRLTDSNAMVSASGDETNRRLLPYAFERSGACLPDLEVRYELRRVI